jgi:hypothetical protein
MANALAVFSLIHATWFFHAFVIRVNTRSRVSGRSVPGG